MKTSNPLTICNPILIPLLRSSFIVVTGLLISALVLADSTTQNYLADQLTRQQREIQALKEKMQELEKLVESQANIIQQLQKEALPHTANHKPPALAAETVTKKETDGVILEGLKFSGFFDVHGYTRGNRQPKLTFGTFELDLEYHHPSHFAMNAALVWDGDEVTVGTGVVDYHWFGDQTPPRGRIFYQKAVHIQAGRFDIPFGNDYQFFATPDRITLTPPVTTELVQEGGFNSDGLRLYGTWGLVDFTAYWVDSLYDSGGTSFGSRLGLGLKENLFYVHTHQSPRSLDIGVSTVLDWDEDSNLANIIYGADLSYSAHFFQVLGEWMYQDNREQASQELDEMAWHLTLILEAEPWLGWPLHPYLRYGRWDPDYSLINLDEQNFEIHALRRLTAGFNYQLNKHLALKLEYFTLFGRQSRMLFDTKSRGLAQLVVSF
ncbi:MAG: hypothetical protein AXA67_10430 [Methylothermaceae bacteria B42]|nr:MAG: hypothetical protein AXA67_10430 [Methylothermaceae bacteria B42]HHJ40515.1 hypothetical protein [Methylothermaceae bacterium]